MRVTDDALGDVDGAASTDTAAPDGVGDSGVGVGSDPDPDPTTDSTSPGSGSTADRDTGATAEDTSGPTGPNEGTATDRSGRLPRSPRIWWIAGGFWVVTVIAVAVLAFIPSGYLVDSPGAAIDTGDLVTLPDDVESFEHPGGFQMVTVSETARAVFGQAFVGWLDPSADVFPRRQVTGDVPRDEELRYQHVLMENAKLSAVYQAMRELGLSASMTGGGVFVDRIIPGSPAQGVLTIGDTITAIDGEPITTTGDISRFMGDAEVGDTITMTVDRLGIDHDMDVDLTLGARSEAEPDAPFLGIYMETRPHYRFPFDVGFDTGDIGGPSAGLALTLSLIDKLSPEPIAGGRTIAVTGSIRPDGSVGPIGGIHQKVVAVIDAGGKYFVVPEANAAEARDAADGKVEIISVETLADTLEQLRALPAPGGD